MHERDEAAATIETPIREERAVTGESPELPERSDTRPELTVLVLLRDQLQKLRIAEGNRAAASLRLEEPDRAELHATYAARIEELENDITRGVKLEVRNHAAWPWLSEIRGVAETSAALVLGYIDIERAPHVSSLWRYAGWAVVDGKRERPVKGQKLAYNARLKTMTWRLIDLQIKASGPYAAIYRNAKHGYITTRMEPGKKRDDALAKLHAVGIETPASPERAVEGKEPAAQERASAPETSMEGERATVRETPVDHKRAEVSETPAAFERAAPNESPIVDERAAFEETPSERERASVRETPTAPERAESVETTAIRERAVRGEEPTADKRAAEAETPVADERAGTDENPSANERAEGPKQPVDPERTFWTLGHCEAAARRKAAKLFLSHLWIVWRTAEGLEVTDPYVMAHGAAAHHDPIDPWEFVKEASS